MRSIGRPISNILFVIGAVSVAVSIYYFWDAYQSKQQQLQRAGDDPFVIVFTDKIQPVGSGIGDNEMTRLNNQRLRSEERGWLLIIVGVGLLVATAGLKSWRKKPVALNIMEDERETSANDFYDPDHSSEENRYIIVGASDSGRLLMVSYTEREDAVRLISARELTAAERKAYEED